MKTAYLSLGSNLDDRENYIYSAYELLEEDDNIKITKFSSLYKSLPYGYDSLNEFLNSCVQIKTSYSPLKLLEKTSLIENKLGRKRLQNVRFSNRTIDIDILFYDMETVKSEKLIVPHYDFENRGFMVLPMAEIAPDFIHPVLNVDMKTLADNFADSKDVEVFYGE